MPRIPLVALCLFCVGCIALASGQPSQDAFVRAAKDYESYANGKQLVIESGSDRIILELNDDQSVMRLILERRDLKANVLTHRYGHYASIPLSQHVKSTSMEDPRSRETNSVLYSVDFLPVAKTLPKVISELGALNFVIQDQLISEYIEQATCSPLPATSGKHGIRCQSPDGRTADIWINEKGQLIEVLEEIKAGDRLADGQICPPGKWTKITRKLQWDSATGRLEQVQSSVKADGGIAGSRNYLIKEELKLEKPLDALIHLEDFHLSDGVSVACQAQPGKPFQFIKGKVVAIVDAASLASAESARWWGSPKGNLLYNCGMVCVLVTTVCVLLWRRKKL